MPLPCMETDFSAIPNICDIAFKMPIALHSQSKHFAKRLQRNILIAMNRPTGDANIGETRRALCCRSLRLASG
jgi:hypothetical protein